MTDRELDKNAARRLAILRHAREVTGNVALTCQYYGIGRQVSTRGCAGMRRGPCGPVLTLAVIEGNLWGSARD